jgi:hypothetical protein
MLVLHSAKHDHLHDYLHCCPPYSCLHHVDYCDHFETPLRAYEDVAEVLSLLAKRLGKTPATLRLWDPYFCEGRAVRHLAALGFTSVHHENKGSTTACVF